MGGEAAPSYWILRNTLYAAH